MIINNIIERSQENFMKYYRISELADALGITKQTLWNWKYKGRIEFVKPYDNNFCYVTENTYNDLTGKKAQEIEHVVIYCRVSSSMNRANLETQEQRLISYCNAKGYNVASSIKEVGSGLNDERPKLISILNNTHVTKIVVEHKDRLTRFGFNYIEVLLKRLGVDIEVVNNVDTDEKDLIQDFVSVITSFCARIYGKRRSQRKTEQLIQEMKND